MITAIILCGGDATRFNRGENKLLYRMGEIFRKTLAAHLACIYIDNIIVVCKEEERPYFEIYSKNNLKPVSFVNSGKTRFESCYNGLKSAKDCEIAVISDGARPFVTPRTIYATIESAIKYGSGIACAPVTDTIRETDGECLSRVIDRKSALRVQTPQAFKYEDIMAAYASVKNGDSFTDDSSVYSQLFKNPRFVMSDSRNEKITYPEDMPPKYVSGIGFDVHPLREGRKLTLCGVEIPYPFGELAFSDGDVAIHALMDAILSALSERDIGYFFPDTDERYRGISSLVLLSRVMEIVKNHNAVVENVSIAIICEKPKIAPYIYDMKNALSHVLQVENYSVGISATTFEKMGDIGQNVAVGAYATASLKLL